MKKYDLFKAEEGIYEEHWRYTASPVRLWFLDCEALIAFVLVVFQPLKIWAWLMAFTIIFCLWLLARRGLSLRAVFGVLMYYLIGKKARAKYPYQTTRFFEE